MNSGARTLLALFTRATAICAVAAGLFLLQATTCPAAAQNAPGVQNAQKKQDARKGRPERPERPARTTRTVPEDQLTFDKAVNKFIDAATGAIPPPVFTPSGLSGGGGLHSPAISPYNAKFILLAGDMGGVYRSLDGGSTWALVNMNQRPGNDFTGGNPARNVLQKRLRKMHLAPRPAFTPARVYWVSDLQYICYSEDHGLNWDLLPQTPWNLEFESNGGNDRIMSFSVIPGIKPQDDYMVVSTTKGVWHGKDNRWKRLSGKAGGPTAATGNILIAAVAADELTISLDRGATWRGGISLPGRVAALAASYNAGGSMFLASVKGKGLFKSADFGKSWQVVKKRYEHEDTLYIKPGQTMIAFALQSGGVKNRHLLRTTDGGKNWRPMFYMPAPGQRASATYNVTPSWLQTGLKWNYRFSPNGLGVSSSNSHFMLVATQGELYATHDGGATWKPFMDRQLSVGNGGQTRRQTTGLEVAGAWGYHFDPHNSTHEYITYADIGFARSPDRGRSWFWSAAGSPWSNTFYDVAFDPAKAGVIYAATSLMHGIPHYGSLGKSPRDPRVNRGGVVLSTNGGVSWKAPYKRKSRTALPDRPCTGVVLDPSSPAGSRVIYASIFGSDKTAGVYVSRDGGKNWAQTPGQPGKLPNRHVYRLRLHPKTGHLYCLVTGLRGPGKSGSGKGGGELEHDGGGLWMSRDQGKSWSHISRGLRLNGWATSFEFDPAGEEGIYVTAATARNGPGTGGVFKTADNGKNWVTLLDDVKTRAITGAYAYEQYMAVAAHPQKHNLIFAGGALNGLFVSRDGGSTWRWCREFPFTSVQSINFDPRDSDRMLITTFGAGVWAASAKAVTALR